MLPFWEPHAGRWTRHRRTTTLPVGSPQPSAPESMQLPARCAGQCLVVEYSAVSGMSNHIADCVSSAAILKSFCSCLQANKRSPGQVAQIGMPNIVSLPSLLSFFGAVPAVTLQQGACNDFPGSVLPSGWQPSCYVAPEASCQAGMSPPASALKGDATATRRAATVASGEWPNLCARSALKDGGIDSDFGQQATTFIAKQVVSCTSKTMRLSYWA